MKSRIKPYDKRNTFYLTGFFFLIIFSGCATKEAVKNISEEEVLRERAMTYWGHKVRQEFDKSYAYEDPYFRKRFNMVKYIKSIDTARARWTAADVESLQINGDSAIIDMKVMVHITVAPSARDIEQEFSLKETWVKVDGIWYHIPKKSGRPEVTN